MEDIITIGGRCPLCGFSRIFMRYDDEKQEGIYRFDACPRCDFAYGNNDFAPPDYNEDVLPFVIKIWTWALKKSHLPATKQGLLKLALQQPGSALDRSVPTVFRYSQDDPDLKESLRRSAGRMFTIWAPKIKPLSIPPDDASGHK